LRSEYRELIDELVDRILSSTSATILLVPHVFGPEEREIEASNTIAANAAGRYPGRVFVLEEPLSEQELKGLIGGTHLFLGSRMHACIAALSQCVPAVGLAYSDKFLGVFESAGVGDAIVDLRKCDTAEVIARTLGAIERRTQLRAQLKARVPNIQAQVAGTFQSMLSAQA